MQQSFPTSLPPLSTRAKPLPDGTLDNTSKKYPHFIEVKLSHAIPARKILCGTAVQHCLSSYREESKTALFSLTLTTFQLFPPQNRRHIFIRPCHLHLQGPSLFPPTLSTTSKRNPLPIYMARLKLSHAYFIARESAQESVRRCCSSVSSMVPREISGQLIFSENPPFPS